MRSDEPGRLAPLDGVRGLAVLIVFLAHASGHGMALATWLDFSRIGRVGVYLFFVLSGFLLTRILVAGQPVGAYLVRRCFRIIPLYFLVVLAVFACQEAGYSSGKYLHFDPGLPSLLGHLTFIKGNGIFWTMPTEFLFYLMLPLLLWLGLRQGIWILAAIAAFAFAYFVLRQYAWLPLPWFNPLDTHHELFLDVFLCGVIAALMVERRIPPLLASTIFALTMIAVLVCISHQFLWFHQPWADLRLMSLWFGVAFAILVLAVAQGNSRLAMLFNNPVLRFVGTIGFGWYLLHLAVIGLVNSTPLVNPQIKLVIATLGTALVAWIAYRLVEQPGIAIGKKLTSAGKRLEPKGEAVPAIPLDSAR